MCIIDANYYNEREKERLVVMAEDTKRSSTSTVPQLTAHTLNARRASPDIAEARSHGEPSALLP
jgi:hypothetical protein